MLQECYKSATGVIQECYSIVTRVLQECNRSVTRVLQKCYLSVTGVLQECPKNGMDSKEQYPMRKKYSLYTCEIEQEGKAIGSSLGHGPREGQHSNLHITCCV